MISKQFLDLLRLQVDAAMTTILNIVRTSPLNVCFASVFNHCGYIVSCPIRCTITGQLHKTPKAMAANVCPANMALIFQSGFAYFDSDTFIKLKNSAGSKGSRVETRESEDEVDVEDEDEEVMGVELGKDNLQEVIKARVNAFEIPTMDMLVPFFQKVFTELSPEDFTYLQSVLMDLYCFQLWTKPLDYKEEMAIQKMVSGTSSTIDTHPVNLTAVPEEYDELGLGGLVFDKFPTMKTPVNHRQMATTTQPNSVPGVTATPSTRTNITPASGKSYSSNSKENARAMPKGKTIIASKGY